MEYGQAIPRTLTMHNFFGGKKEECDFGSGPWQYAAKRHLRVNTDRNCLPCEWCAVRQSLVSHRGQELTLSQLFIFFRENSCLLIARERDKSVIVCPNDSISNFRNIFVTFSAAFFTLAKMKCVRILLSLSLWSQLILWNEWEPKVVVSLLYHIAFQKKHWQPSFKRWFCAVANM